MALRTCNGKVQDFGGTARTRKVWITPSQPTTLIGSPGLELPASPIGVAVATDGTFSQTLQANADLSPAGTYYTLTVPTGDAVDATFAFVVPQSAGPFDISQLGVVPSAPIPPAAQDSLVMHLAQVEHVTGQKIYDTNPVFNAGALPESAVASLVADLATLTAGVAAAAVDSTVMHKALAETVTGVKLFSAAPEFAVGALTDNGQALQWKDSAGTAINGVIGASDNTFRIGWISAAPVTNGHLIMYAAGTEAARFTPGGSFTIHSSINGLTLSTGQFRAGSGTDLNYGSIGSSIGAAFQASIGTTATPDEANQSVIKVSRSMKVMDADAFAADAAQSTVVVYTHVDSASQRQGIGVYSITQTASSGVSGSGKQADGVALFGIGWSLAGSTHIGQGAYIEGRRDDSGGFASSVEARVTNQSGVDGVYNTAAFSGTVGFWMTAGGNARSAAAIQMAGVSGQQWVVGLGAIAGSIKNEFIRDDSSGLTSILIQGSHATGALMIGDTAGNVTIGNVNAQTAKFSILGTYSDATGAFPVGFQTNYTINAAGKANIFVAGSAIIATAIAGTHQYFNFNPSLTSNPTSDTTKTLTTWIGFSTRMDTASLYSANVTSVINSYAVGMNHAGSGTIANLHHYRIGNPPAPTGTITTEIGLYVEALTRGGTNRSIYFVTSAAPVEVQGGLDLILDTTTGLRIGTGITQKLAFHGSTAVAQRAGAAQVAVVTTASTQTTPWGFATQAQADSIVTLVNELRAMAVEKGLMKGAA